MAPSAAGTPKNVAPFVSTRLVPSLFVTVTLTLPAVKMLSGPAPTVGSLGMNPPWVMPSKPVPSVGASGENEPFPPSAGAGVVSSVNCANDMAGRNGGLALSRSTSCCASSHSCSRRSVIGMFSEPGARCGRSEKLNERGTTRSTEVRRAPVGPSGGTGGSNAARAAGGASSVSESANTARVAGLIMVAFRAWGESGIQRSKRAGSVPFLDRSGQPRFLM